MSIQKKIQKVQSKIKELVRDEENKFQKYFFFNELQILKILKPLLEEYKLSMIISDDPSFPLIHERGEKEHVLKYLKKVQIFDVESNDSDKEKFEINFWACGQNTDISKAKGSAETYSMKYILSKLFLIPIREIDDPDYKI